MKILQVNKFFYLKGGSERYFFELSKILERRGHAIAHFSMEDRRNAESKYKEYFIEHVGLDKFSLKNIIKIFYNFNAKDKLDKLIRDFKPDIAHLHNIDRQLGSAIINLLKKRGVPVVMTLHDFKAFCPKGTLYNNGKHCDKCIGGSYLNCVKDECVKNSFLKSALAAAEAYWQKWILKSYSRVDMFHAPSLYMKNIALRAGIPENKIIHLVYPIDGNQDNGVKENKGGYLLYFGRLSEEKGIETLIRAMGIVKGEVKLKVAGEGLLHEKLIKLREDFGLREKIEFVGFQDDKSMEALIKDAKAVVIPSLWPENMPYSLLESMAAGKIIIASRTGGIPERIIDWANGYLFSPGNIGELAKKIDLAISENDDNLGQKARFSINEFSSIKHYNELVKIYNLLILNKI